MITQDLRHGQDYTPGREAAQANTLRLRERAIGAYNLHYHSYLRAGADLVRSGTMASSHETIGSRIARIRRASGLQQQELARRSGLHTSSLNQIERGKRTPTTATIERIATALEVHRDVLLDGEAAPQAPIDHEAHPAIPPEIVPALQKAVYAMLQDAVIAIGLSIEHREARAAAERRGQNRVLAPTDALRRGSR